MFHDPAGVVAAADDPVATGSPIAADGTAIILASLLKPQPTLFGLEASDMSLVMTAEDEKPDWQLLKNMMGTGITLTQMMEGIGKSLIFLELLLRTGWQPTPDELQRAIARSPYAGTTDKNEILETPVCLSRRALYVAAEGKLKMHRNRSAAIMRNNIGVIDAGEQARILSRAQIVSNRTLYEKLVRHNPDFKGGMRFFRLDRKTGHWEATAYYLELIKWIEDMQARSDEAVAALDALNLPPAQHATLLEKIEEERIGLVIVDTFGAIWGPRAVDDEGLQAVNQRVNADADRLRIAMPVIAHTNKSEKVDEDDHRAAGKGAVEMHSTVEGQFYGRQCTEDEMKKLQAKGECADYDQYLAVRVGKTNLHHIDRNVRIGKRLPDGAPVWITRKLGLLGVRIERSKDGFTRTALKLQLCSAVQFLDQGQGANVTAGGLQKMVGANKHMLATNFPALMATTKEASGSDEWKLSTLMGELVKDGCLEAKRHGNGTIYSYIRHPQETKL